MKQMTKGMIRELAVQKKPQKEADESENTDMPVQLLKQLESGVISPKPRNLFVRIGFW